MSRTQANMALLLVAIIWGVGAVIQQVLLQHVGPLMANGLTRGLAVTFVLPILLYGRETATRLDRRGKWLAAIVVASYALATTGYQAGLGYTLVSNANFMTATATVIAPVLSWLALRKRPETCITIAALIAGAGVVLIGGGSPSTLTSGDLLCLGSAFCFAVWIICLGEFVQRYGRPAWITAVQLAATALLCFGGAAVFEPVSLDGVIAAVPCLLYVGLIDAGFACYLQALAQRHTSGVAATVLVSTDAVFAAICAWLILNEQLDVMGMTGAALIFVAIMVVQISPRRLRLKGRGADASPPLAAAPASAA